MNVEIKRGDIVGLTFNSTGKSIHKVKNIKEEGCMVYALAGNPNVGKSTVFNKMTGLNQHTGNWAGKTVASAEGYYKSGKNRYKLIDLPGTYSIISNSKEEEIARDFICFENYDGIIIICDATCLERNLNLVLQILEITDNVTVLVNLMDEAKKKGIRVDLKKLSEILNVNVIGICARTGEGINKIFSFKNKNKNTYKIKYSYLIENAIKIVEESLEYDENKLNKRWFSIRLLCKDNKIIEKAKEKFGIEINKRVEESLEKAFSYLKENNIEEDKIEEMIVSLTVLNGESISLSVVTKKEKKDKILIDKIITNKYLSYPIMLLFLGMIFYITLSGANYFSDIISEFLFKIEGYLIKGAQQLNINKFIYEMLILGGYRTVSWIVAVMLPPMAIFFPLFTFLEDLGFLPRIAFNLDRGFKKCNTCGKQALTMCMGFGCNAAGVVGTRIIDSKRERLIAILTNNFVPCNGRFPGIITIISIFFATGITGLYGNVLSSVILTLFIILSVVVTLIISKLLANTVLKGEVSNYVLELPPYRKPQISKIIVRSVLDRTVFVLLRAIVIAIPAGILIWLISNIKYGGISLLGIIANFCQPFGRFIGLDGVILLAFILGMPANEIVIPIMAMTYMSSGVLSEVGNLEILRNIFISNGWTYLTAINTIIFSLFHFPCSTTLLSIYKETKSVKWTLASFVIPTVTGILICLLIKILFSIFDIFL